MPVERLDPGTRTQESVDSAEEILFADYQSAVINVRTALQLLSSAFMTVTKNDEYLKDKSMNEISGRSVVTTMLAGAATDCKNTHDGIIRRIHMMGCDAVAQAPFQESDISGQPGPVAVTPADTTIVN